MAVQIILNVLSMAVVLLVGTIIAWRVFGSRLKPQAPTLREPPSAKEAIVGSVLLQNLIGNIKSELRQLEAQGGVGSGLELEEITIELLAQTEKKKEGDVQAEPSVTVPIFDKLSVEAGISLARTETHTTKVTVTLEPDFPTSKTDGWQSPAIEFADLLIGIRTALEVGIDMAPKLSANALEIELSFVLVESDTQEGKVEVLVVSAGASTSSEDKNSNTVKLAYKKSDAKKEKAAQPKSSKQRSNPSPTR